MIVRERVDEFVMITQHDHARISGECAKHWSSDFFHDLSKRNAVELAITEHDRGWIIPDEMPRWNNEKAAPHSFMDYPLPKKLALYKTGIDEVEAMDAYAAFLCSEHYVRFTSRNDSPEAQHFVQNERTRQIRLKEMIDTFNEKAFQFHYNLLAFCDNLSLYICLNEPGITKEKEHRFFQAGIPVPENFSFLSGERLPVHWKDKQTIMLAEFPFEKPFEIKIKKKVVSKKEVEAQGIKHSYRSAPVETIRIFIEEGKR